MFIGENEFCREAAYLNHWIVSSNQSQIKTAVKSLENVTGLFNEFAKLEEFKFKVLGHPIFLKNIECVLFRWDSGGITFVGFKNAVDGIQSSFSYKHIKKADKANSGEVYFIEWHKNLKEWPKVECVEQGGKTIYCR